MNKLRLAAIQTNLFWENKEKNLQHLTKKLASLSSDLDLIILPEMFTTGFSMRPSHIAESMSGVSVEWMRDHAKQKNSAIVGSLVIEENQRYFNRLIFAFPSGSIEFYDKRHLFRLAGEHNFYSLGSKRSIIKYKNWRINLNICYDLRFPVWVRNRNDYDVSIYIANWPEKRAAHWNTLLQARAIENLAYVVGLNRIGNDANGFYHSGNSAIVHPNGKHLSYCEHKEAILLSEISLSELHEYREKFAFHHDADEFEIKT